MANQLCFAAAHEAGNQQQFDNTQGLDKQSNEDLSKAIPTENSSDKAKLSLKGKIARSYNNWAAKKCEQVVKNGWG